ncbi:hypothetical protein AA313_de0208136 [Arthrobotrys entomopaga]|nr:hypothetical protein AA313_de0208136 [Arthrobotrys entomopaga]
MSSTIEVASSASTGQPSHFFSDFGPQPSTSQTTDLPPGFSIIPDPSSSSTFRTSKRSPNFTSDLVSLDVTLPPFPSQTDILSKVPALQTPPVMTPYHSTPISSTIISPSSPTNLKELGTNDSSETPSTEVQPKQTSSHGLNAGQAIGIALGCLIFILLLGLGVAFLVKRRREKAREKATQTKGLRDLKLVMAYSETERDISDSWSPAPVSAISGVDDHDLEGYGSGTAAGAAALPPVAEYMQSSGSARSSAVRLPLTR